MPARELRVGGRRAELRFVTAGRPDQPGRPRGVGPHGQHGDRRVARPAQEVPSQGPGGGPPMSLCF